MDGLIVGQALRRWRHRASLSQEELAARASVSARHLSRVECGKARASPEVLFRLMQALALSPVERDQLLDWMGLRPLGPEPENSVQLALEGNPACELNEAGHVVATNGVFDACLSLVGEPQALWRAACGDGPRSVEQLTTSPDGLRSALVNPEEVLESLHLPVGARPPERYRVGGATFSFRLVETRVASEGRARIWLSLVPVDGVTRGLVARMRAGF